MTKSTLTTEAIAGVADLKAGYTLGHADVAILKALAADLLAVREAQRVPVKFALSTLDGHIQKNKESVFNSQQGAERVLSALSKALSTKINLKIVPLYTAPPAPAVPDDYQHLKHVSESYFAVEKRLFDLAQRLKGPSFDHYAYSLHQAIDVLDKEIFGESEDNSAMLAAAPTPTKAVNDENNI